MPKIHEFDLLVLGSGGAGCCAALAGAAAGLSTYLIDKAPQLGGGTADSLGTIWIPNNRLAAAAGLADDHETALRYARFVAGGQEVAANLEAYVREAPRVLNALLALGVQLRLALGLPDYFAPAGPGSCADGRRMVEPELIARAELGTFANSIRPSIHNVSGVAWSDGVKWGGFANRRNWPHDEVRRRQDAGLLACGEALIGHMVARMLARGATIWLNRGTKRLILQEGKVIGVTLTDGTTVNARRGVILATGGYEGNPELVRRFEGFPQWMNPFAPTNTGDAITLTAPAGAGISRVAVNNSLFVGAAVPGQPEAFFSVGLRGLPMPGAIAVNARGQRFCDETQFQDVVMALQQYDRAARQYANLPAYMIFDDRFRQRYPVANAPPGQAAHPSIVRANTVPELAAALGIDAAGLTATTQRFNADVAAGRDSVFGRGQSAFSRNNAGDAQLKLNPQLAPLDQPPYYALPLKMGGVCSAGLMTDASSRVLNTAGDPISGLYACGNTAAPTFLGVGYQGGASIGAGMVFGFLAAEHAAARID